MLFLSEEKKLKNFSDDYKSDDELISKMKGKTLLIYWTLLKKQKSIGVRELQRTLDLSSPSVASYHLEKLLYMGVVQKNKDGSYILSRKVPLTELTHFIMFRLSNRIILLPRFIFYLTFFILTSLGYWFFFFKPPLNTASFFVLIFSISSIGVSLFETIKQYKDRPW